MSILQETIALAKKVKGNSCEIEVYDDKTLLCYVNRGKKTPINNAIKEDMVAKYGIA